MRLKPTEKQKSIQNLVQKSVTKQPNRKYSKRNSKNFAGDLIDSNDPITSQLKECEQKRLRSVTPKQKIDKRKKMNIPTSSDQSTQTDQHETVHSIEKTQSTSNFYYVY